MVISRTGSLSLLACLLPKKTLSMSAQQNHGGLSARFTPPLHPWRPSGFWRRPFSCTLGEAKTWVVLLHTHTASDGCKHIPAFSGAVEGHTAPKFWRHGDTQSIGIQYKYYTKCYLHSVVIVIPALLVGCGDTSHPNFGAMVTYKAVGHNVLIRKKSVVAHIMLL